MTEPVPNRALPEDYPLRHLLAGEVHARPFQQLAAPVRASHLALISGERPAAADRACLGELCRLCEVEPPEPDALFFVDDFPVESGSFRLRWERHTEFSTYTFYRFDPLPSEAERAPFAETALDLVPADWLAALPGEMISATHLVLEGPGRTNDSALRVFPGGRAAGSQVGGGGGSVWTDFQLGADGFTRILMSSKTMTPGQAGRLMQRMMEIETYRMLALIGLPLAKDLLPRIACLEAGVSEVVGRLAESDRQGSRDTDADRALLARLTALSAESEEMASQVGYRFAASEAYHRIVTRRIEDLRETRIPGLQTIAEFMNRRFAPAMHTCQSTAYRMNALSDRLTRAGAMLRTRVDIALEEGNRDLLETMSRRVAVQIRLQQTVEGLSVVAISYYLMGLVAYALKGAEAAGLLPFDADVGVFVGLPVVAGLVFVGVRRLRHAVTGKEDPVAAADSGRART